MMIWAALRPGPPVTPALLERSHGQIPFTKDNGQA
jgi:hypothetical protein